ncbi:efflux RND transporter periplasmic adaptor subunit [Paenibacillus arenosi]|uniref:Efflux RND transporter periplasmic adaptor subunit n=1 Tax=Paenibacillus arenosi TaxID=2774142 RepID=A0ABR9B3Z7_9BACL|nr:efflux RND transporter periplasmic adaptor subunit [Paenibacillus arenosi]MBD8500876.1 efflux RND transporter periplasmic adaptor subunit [Paenibacillus arenosi]
MKMQVIRSTTPKRLILKVCVLLLCTAYVAGCSTSPTPAATSENTSVKQNEPQQVKVVAVGKHSMGDPREQIAEVHAVTQVEVRVEAGGALVKLLKKTGEVVQAGEVIAKLESRDAKIAKEKAKLALKTAELSLSTTKDSIDDTRLQLTTNVNKLKEAMKQQIREGASETELESNQLELQASITKLEALDRQKTVALKEAEVATSKLELEQTEQTWNDGHIVSPANGILTDIKLTEGTNIQAGSILGAVQMTETVKIKAHVTDSAAKLIGSKKSLTFRDPSGNGTPRTAKVIHLSDVPDAATRLYTLELEASNTDYALKPLSRVHVQLTTPEEETVAAVPSLSVVREGRASFVFVLNGNKAEKREVQLGRVKGPYQEVISGIKTGEQLVVSGQHNIAAGEVVKVVQ